MLDAVAAVSTGRARVASGAIFSDVPARPVVITSVTRAAATGRGGGSSDDESDDDALGLASLGSGDPTPAGLAILCVILVVVLCAGAACFYVERVSGEGDDKVDEEAPSEKQVEDEKEAPEDAPAPRPVRRGSGLDVDGVRCMPPREDPTRTRLTFTFKAPQLGIAFCPDGTAGMLQPGSEAEAKKFGSARPAPKSSRETS